jgi:hypothetical protein
VGAELAFVWNFLSCFGAQLGLPPCSLEELVDALALGHRWAALGGRLLGGRLGGACASSCWANPRTPGALVGLATLSQGPCCALLP